MKKSLAVLICSSLFLTSPGLNFYQAWASVRVGINPGASLNGSLAGQAGARAGSFSPIQAQAGAQAPTQFTAPAALTPPSAPERLLLPDFSLEVAPKPQLIQKIEEASDPSPGKSPESRKGASNDIQSLVEGDKVSRPDSVLPVPGAASLANNLSPIVLRSREIKAVPVVPAISKGFSKAVKTGLLGLGLVLQPALALAGQTATDDLFSGGIFALLVAGAIYQFRNASTNEIAPSEIKEPLKTPALALKDRPDSEEIKAKLYDLEVQAMMPPEQVAEDKNDDDFPSRIQSTAPRQNHPGSKGQGILPLITAIAGAGLMVEAFMHAAIIPFHLAPAAFMTGAILLALSARMNGVDRHGMTPRKSPENPQDSKPAPPAPVKNETFRLAVKYYSGDGTLRNYERAAKLFLRTVLNPASSEMERMASFYFLGEMNRKQQLINWSLKEAYAYYLLAGQTQDEKAAAATGLPGEDGIIITLSGDVGQSYSMLPDQHSGVFTLISLRHIKIAIDKLEKQLGSQKVAKAQKTAEEFSRRMKRRLDPGSKGAVSSEQPASAPGKLKGIVKELNEYTGEGLITPEDGSRNLPVAFPRPNSDLYQGAEVEFKVIEAAAEIEKVDISAPEYDFSGFIPEDIRQKDGTIILTGTLRHRSKEYGAAIVYHQYTEGERFGRVYLTSLSPVDTGTLRHISEYVDHELSGKELKALKTVLLKHKDKFEDRYQKAYLAELLKKIQSSGKTILPLVFAVAGLAPSLAHAFMLENLSPAQELWINFLIVGVPSLLAAGGAVAGTLAGHLAGKALFLKDGGKEKELAMIVSRSLGGSIGAVGTIGALASWGPWAGMPGGLAALMVISGGVAALAANVYLDRGTSSISKTGESSFYVFQAKIRNALGDMERRMSYTGPRRIMYKELARKLVDEKRWFMISLDSGMQMPILDAIKYLAEVKDTESIPRLKELWEKYTGGISRGPRTYEWEGFTVTDSYGPADYVPQYVQNETAQALLRLLPEAEARKFARTALESKLHFLDDYTAKNLLRFVMERGQSELAPLLLSLARTLQKEIERNGWSSYDTLYKYQDLAHAAYKLSSDSAVKEEALKMLVDTYNSRENWDGMLRATVARLLSDIIDDLPTDLAYKAIQQLDKERYESDAGKEFFGYLGKAPKRDRRNPGSKGQAVLPLIFAVAGGGILVGAVAMAVKGEVLVPILLAVAGLELLGMAALRSRDSANSNKSPSIFQNLFLSLKQMPPMRERIHPLSALMGYLSLWLGVLGALFATAYYASKWAALQTQDEKPAVTTAKMGNFLAGSLLASVHVMIQFSDRLRAPYALPLLAFLPLAFSMMGDYSRSAWDKNRKSQERAHRDHRSKGSASVGLILGLGVLLSAYIAFALSSGAASIIFSGASAKILGGVVAAGVFLFLHGMAAGFMGSRDRMMESALRRGHEPDLYWCAKGHHVMSSECPVHKIQTENIMDSRDRMMESALRRGHEPDLYWCPKGHYVMTLHCLVHKIQAKK